MLSTILLILVILAAAAGLIYYLHREAHRDCSCGCEACVLAKSCKKATLSMVALLVALTSAGINVEHHCAHCHHHDVAEHCHDHGPCAHCDHCSDCYFLHLDLDQYNSPQTIDLPEPEMLSLWVAVTMPEVVATDGVMAVYDSNRSLHAPPREGRHILCEVGKLTV